MKLADDWVENNKIMEMEKGVLKLLNTSTRISSHSIILSAPLFRSIE